MEESLAADLARASIDWINWGFILVAPAGTAFALWRMRRGVAEAGLIGLVARLLAGSAVLVGLAYLAALAMGPGVEQLIDDCNRAPIGATVDCQDNDWAPLPVVLSGLVLAAAWPVLALVTRMTMSLRR